MLVSRLLSTIPVFLLLSSAQAAIKPFINTEADVITECKTCPRSLCPNVQVHDQESGPFSVTCWTRGTKIMGDRLWLKTDAGCYVTQYDVTEYAGDYTEDLAYCGRESEEQDLTIEEAETKYKTECRICPQLSCSTVAYLRENTDLELTCWYPDGQVIIDDPVWLKTTNNCYVAQKNLYSKPDITYLESCGPVPYLEPAVHNNVNGTSDVNKREADPAPLPQVVDRSLMYLVNVTVGEEYAYCRTCPKESCSVKKRFEFNQEVWLQCLTRAVNETLWWSETTDFCYMKSSDFWESPEGDNYRFPLCEYFDEPGNDPGDED